jgi:hypothetical protein
MKGEVMDVVLFMMRQLNDLKMDKNQNLAYAPYIMALIKAKTRFEGWCETAHPIQAIQKWNWFSYQASHIVF